jgi:Ca-activated chloride channel family protein
MSFTNPHFAEPVWLWLALLGPVAVVMLQRYSARARRKQLARIASPEFTAALTRSHSPGRRLAKEIFLVGAVAAMGLALARPQWGEQRADETQLLGDDVIFALDCSTSMLAADVTPNRLQRAKLAILDFVERHGGGRVGLVAFAGQAFLQCPLTPDYDAFRDALMAMDEKTIPVAGTDVGRALDEAFLAMDKSDESKLIVLLTDGEDLEKSGIKKAEALAKQGVTIFTIGVGTPAGAMIQTLNEQGQPTLMRDAKGEVVRSRLDESTLRAIAAATRADYRPLGPLGEGLARLRSAIENRKVTTAGTTGRKRGVDRFHLLVAVALGLVVAESLLGTRRKTA